MNIGIIDADLVGRKKHRFPNLACMKISGYYKEHNNHVKLVTDYRNLFSKYIEIPQDQDTNFSFIMYDDTSHKGYVRYYQEKDIMFDKIIISKVFIDTPVPLQIKHLNICEYGGTGFFYDKAEPLPYEIEHHMPDYHLYDEWIDVEITSGGKPKDFRYYTEYSIGFTTRGCFRKCPFCVNKNYNKVELHSPIEEFLDKDRKKICLLDDNILGFGQWKTVLHNLQSTNLYFEYKQGMDMRLITDKKAGILSESKYIGDFIFAFDNIEDREIIETKLKIWKQYCTKTTKLYVFCGFDREDQYTTDFWKQDIIDTFERIKILMRYGCLPYIMRHVNYEKSPYRGMYINIARWCNQPNFFKKKSFREFCETNQALTKNGMGATMRYMTKLEKEYPEIAQKYYDLKFENIREY